jgi:hypothetical protein
MAGSAKFYDPDLVAIYFNGAIVQGYADGEFITVAQVSNGFDDVVGTDGEVARSKSNDRRVEVTIKLLQTSSTNAAFSVIHNLDLNAPNGAGVGTFLMQDLQGGTIVHGDQAWIVKYPDDSMDRTAKSREWVLRIANADRAETGN